MGRWERAFEKLDWRADIEQGDIVAKQGQEGSGISI